MDITTGFFTGSSLGYFLGKLFGGPKNGQEGLLDPIIFSFQNWQIHLHHWLIALMSLIFLFFFVRKKYKLNTFILSFCAGFFGGLIFQGIFSYSDWRSILIKQE
jgi:hypothetical protein